MLNDIDGARGIDVVMDRDTEAAETLLASLGAGEDGRPVVEAVAMDMWPAYMNAVAEMLPDAALVHERSTSPSTSTTR